MKSIFNHYSNIKWQYQIGVLSVRQIESSAIERMTVSDCKYVELSGPLMTTPWIWHCWLWNQRRWMFIFGFRFCRFWSLKYSTSFSLYFTLLPNELLFVSCFKFNSMCSGKKETTRWETHKKKTHSQKEQTGFFFKKNHKLYNKVLVMNECDVETPTKTM